MKKTVWTRSFGYSGNLKSKTCPEISRRIENPKWLGLWVFALMLVVTEVVTDAQPPKVYRIGYLSGRGPSPPREEFIQALRNLGYVEGKNIAIEHRSADNKRERMPDLAAEMVPLKVDIIVAEGIGTTSAAKKATTTFPSS